MHCDCDALEAARAAGPGHARTNTWQPVVAWRTAVTFYLFWCVLISPLPEPFSAHTHAALD